MTAPTAPPGALEYPLDALTSFHYYRADDAMAPLIASGRLRLIGDSGAFSALTQGTPIKLPEYVEWCKKWSPHLYWTATLDVIGDPAATLNNWRTMRDTHQLATVPTLHVGADPRLMDPYVKDGCDFIALGGMVGRALQSLPWLVKVFRYARDHHPQVRFHTWGVVHRKVTDNLPAYSGDSSTFAAGHRFARLTLFDPRTGKHTSQVRMMHHDVHAVGPLLRDVYGVSPAEILTPTRENRATVMRVFALSYQLYGKWLQARHNVSPPTWGINPNAPGLRGTRIHAVSAKGGGSVDDLQKAVTDPEPGPDKELTGTRAHVVEASAGNMRRFVSMEDQ